jgi:hypothetical protein
VDNLDALLELPKFTDGRVSERYVNEMPRDIRDHFNVCRGIGNLQYISIYPGAPTLTYLAWTYDPAIDGIPDTTTVPTPPPPAMRIDFAYSEYVDLALLEEYDALVSIDTTSVKQVDNWEALLDLPNFSSASVSENQAMEMPPELKERFNIVRGMGGTPWLPALYPDAPYLIFMDWTYDPAIDDLANQDLPEP